MLVRIFLLDPKSSSVFKKSLSGMVELGHDNSTSKHYEKRSNICEIRDYNK